MFKYTFIIMLILSSYSFCQSVEDTCYPPCRTGFVCYKGNCVSKCNPPCPDNTKCTDEGTCVPIAEETGENNQQSEALSVKPVGKRNVPCTPIVVVAPQITAEMLGGSFTKGELNNASYLLAEAVAERLKGSSIITPDEMPDVVNCRSQCILIRLIKYYKKPARLGQYRGFISIQIERRHSLKDSTPYKVEIFDASGNVHWGDSTPFANAVEEVCEDIVYRFKP